MGWLFSERWLERKDLIKHLTEGNGVKTLKHCTVGNNLWCVHETQYGNNTIRFICLYMMKGPMPKNAKYTGADRDWWGYKDVDECMGPCEITCPVSYLEMCTAPENQYAYDWRQRVYARARRAREFKIGSEWRWGDKIMKIIKRRSPSSFLAQSHYGDRWRITMEQALSLFKPLEEAT
jgi:hypothetical protein